MANGGDGWRGGKGAQRLSERLFAIHRRQPVAVAFRLHARARHEAQRGGVHAVPQTAPIGWPIVKHVPEVDLRVGRPHLDAVAPWDAMIRVLGQQLVRDRLGERRPTAAGIEFVAR